MSDTKQRIAEYKKLLPGLKERVVAVALLLVISLTMVTTTTFAWFVLSRRPQLTGVSTTIAANGNLEIALAGPNGSAPGASGVGDSFAAEGKTIVDANLTWGNLINLSDPAYGLEHLVLRPAQLNESALATSPLYGAKYGADGRIEELVSNFGYATWAPEFNYFEITENYGVRAISSTKLETNAGPYPVAYQNAMAAAKNANVKAINTYLDITNDTDWMPSLATIMGTYMTARLNATQGDETLTNPTMDKQDIVNLKDMFAQFIIAFEQEKEAMVALANFQLFVENKGGPTFKEGSAYTPFTLETLFAYESEGSTTFNFTDAELAGMGVQITNRAAFLEDYNLLCADYEKLVAICNLTTIKWQNTIEWEGQSIHLSTIINNFVDVGKCTIDGTPVNSIGASNALGYLNKTCSTIITNGVLKNFEQRTGASMYVGREYEKGKGLMVKATVKRSIIKQDGTIYAMIETNATKPSLFDTDLAYGVANNEGGAGEMVANDTYGLAIDFWVRTNATNHALILEGNVLTKTDIVRATGVDRNGKTVELYTITRTEEITEGGETTENGETTPVTTTQVTTTTDLYKMEITENGTTTTTWYDANTHGTFELQDGEEPKEKMIEVETVIGYEGDNRVWDKNAGLSIDSTTQGSGSCYVYYADTPEDQARSLKLLQSMFVAFVDEQGALMAVAQMDTEHHYAANGKVIVPLVLRADSMVVGHTINGDEVHAITSLEKNTPTRVTALVYLDGTKLTNQDVLAAADIQGQLNIQFGTWADDLDHAENEKLQNQEVKVTATVDKTSFKYDTDPDLTTNIDVTVTTDGEQPKNVTAFFLRAINATQGSREETVTFTYAGSGKWTASYTFTAPGNYILRSIRLDGNEYDLETRPTVTVEGFTVESLSWNPGATSGDGTASHATIMTADGSRSVDVSLKFATNDITKMPSSVQGRFLRQDGTAANINFTYNATEQRWQGTATFVTSGTYTLQYLVLDGEYTELASGLWKTAVVYLGMKTAVYTDSPVSFKLLPSEMTDDQTNLAMKVKIMTDVGEEMEALENTSLTYALRGSATKAMYTELKWNAVTGYYEGVLHPLETGAGIYEFGNVTVNGNVITRDTTSPTFTLISPEPPEYVGYASDNKTEVYAPKNDATIGVDIAYSATATVVAKFKNLGNEKNLDDITTNDVLIEVQGSLYAQGAYADANGRPINRWIFTIPNGEYDTKKTQDGKWQLVELNIWNYYEKDGTYVSAEIDEDGKLVAGGDRDQAMVVDLSGENHTIKVVVTINVSFAEGQSKDFTGSFMDTHSITGLSVRISDYEGKPIANLTNVELTYRYGGETSLYGGYAPSGQDVLATDSIFSITFALDTSEGADGTRYVQDSEASAQYAGVYLPTLKYKIDGTLVPQEVTLKNVTEGEKISAASVARSIANAPVFTVSSEKPTVTISSVDTLPAGARFFTTATPSSKDHVTTGLKNWKSDDGYSASVFMYVEGPSGPMDTELVTLKYPSITLDLAGIPADHSGVDFVVKNGSNSSQSNVFTFAAGETEKSSTIGAGQNGTFSYGFAGVGAGVETWPKLYPVGKQEIKTIDVTYKGVDYVVTLSSPVNISQTLVPPYADLVINESTYSGATRIYSADTENVVLNKMTWSVNGVEVGDDATVGAWSKKTLHTDHGYKTWSWWILSDERYMPFYWTEFTREITGTQTPYTTTYTINKWIVNGKEYDVSQKAVSIAVSGSIQATAVVTVNTVYGDTTETTIKEFKYGYVQGSQQRGNPGGVQIGSTVTTENGAYDLPTIGIANETTLEYMYDDKDQYLQCDNRAGG